MSLATGAINANDYIARLYDILSNSSALLPNSIGNNKSAQDLVNEIIQYELPFPEQPREGPGPPHVFITLSKQSNPIYRTPLGRSTVDQLGPEKQIWEFYIIAVDHQPDVHTSEQHLHSICNAIVQTLDTNKRLTDHTGANPLCSWLEWIEVPYILDVDERAVMAKNIVVRAHAFVNMRTS